MHKTFRFRIYPNKSQVRIFDSTLEVCRHVYNRTLETRKNAWEKDKKSISLFSTHNLLKVWAEEFSDNKTVHSRVLQDVQVRVDLALKSFFRRLKSGDEKPGYPRFKGKGRYHSFTYNQSGFKVLPAGKIYLSKIGNIKINLHRAMKGKIKTVTISRSSTEKWYASFVCETDTTPSGDFKKAIGIDVGLTHFATLSTGEKVDNPRFFRNGERALAKAQRKMCKFSKGTTPREKARKVVSHVHEKIANRRKDFSHKLSRQWVNRYGIICLEKLGASSMLKNHSLAKSISDASWGQLIQYTCYKAVDAGKKCVLVNPMNTSKKCSRCGGLVEKDLSTRTHDCPYCGLVLDRDVNAAINILGLGLQALGESPKSLPS